MSDNPLLQRSAANQLPHALILETDASSAQQLVDDFIQGLSINPADYLLFTKTEPIKVKDAREIRRFVGMTRYTSPLKLVFIADARQLTTEAANALLKTLEEPPEGTVLILATMQVDDLLPTIRSRCRVIRINPISETPLVDAIDKQSLPECFDLTKKLAESDKPLATYLEGWLKQLDPSDSKRQTILLNYLPHCQTNVNRRLLLDNLFLDLYTID